MKTFEERFDEKFETKEIITTQKNIIEVAIKKDKRSSTRDSVKNIKKFFKEEIKRITDEMIGEEQKTTIIRGDLHGIYPMGYNNHRQHCIDTINKYLK